MIALVVRRRFPSRCLAQMNPINWNLPCRPKRLFLTFFSLRLGVVSSSLDLRPFLSLGSLSRYENSHERRRHERRGAKRDRYTRPHHQGPAVCHTVSRPPFSPRRSVLTIDLDPTAFSVQHSAPPSTCKQNLLVH